MSIAEDAAGQLVDAALIGATFEKGGKGKQAHDEHCANCGAELHGRYCHVCGQRGHVHRSVLHLCEEFFHGLFHLDGKIWHTAPLLLFRPGALTRRFIEGQRVRFISPIGLFLFSIFLMFFAVSTVDPTQGNGVHVNVAPPEQREKIKADIDKAREEVDKAGGNPEAMVAARAALDAAEKAASPAPPSAAPLSAAPPSAAPPSAAPADAKPKKAGAEDEDDDDLFSKPLGFDWRAASKKLAKKNISVGFGGPDAAERVRASLNDPDLLVYKLRSAASEYSFMLVPASVPFLWLMFFWKRRVYLYDHVIFSLHSLAFMALFVSLLVAGFDLQIGRHFDSFWAWMFFVPPVHMFFHLKGTYKIGIFGALWRTFMLSFIALIVLLCYVAVIVMLGLLH